MGAERQPSDALIGQVVADRYQILQRIGEGAMGVVYKARHVKVGRPFAVKVLHPRVLADPKIAQRFEREAKLAGRLRHPNVVGVVDLGDVAGVRYMVMEFAEGPDLAKLLAEAPMPPQRIIHLVRQMLEGLYHAHAQGLIHRDFKPENVIVERDAHGAEVPRIVDFGIALLRDGGDSAGGVGRLTTHGLVLGTPHYMAPEQAVADPIDHRIDLFALGIVIYEMLSGALPFDGNGAEVARANLLLDPPPIARRVEHLEVDPLLEAFARRLMAKSRDARPATAKAARELLDLIDQDRPAAARILGVPVARSGRAAAVTEPVDPRGPTGSAETSPVAGTSPAPGVGQPISPGPAGQAPASPGAAPLDPAAAQWIMPGVGALASRQLTGPPANLVYSAPHALGARTHDPGIPTPRGWPAASWPSRRRPWLIGGAVAGTAGVLAAIAIFLVPGLIPGLVPGPARSLFTDSGSDADQSQPASRDRVAASGAGIVPSAPESDRTSGDSPRAPDPAGAREAPAPASPPRQAPGERPSDAAGVAGVGRGRAGRDGAMIDDKSSSTSSGHRTSRRPVGDVPREASSGDGEHLTERAGHTRAPAAVTPPASDGADPARREVAPRNAHGHGTAGAAHDTGKVKPGAPGGARPPAPPAGITPAELAALYDAAGREIHQLPEAEQGDLMNRLTRFHVMDEMRAPQEQRDRTAAQLVQIRDEARRRRDR